MGVTIPLPELDLPKPAPASPPDALAEFQRAASLETSAAQQQAIQAQAQGQQQQNQMQAMQLKDEQLRRSLAPQFVQKDDNGKPSGFDSEGLYNAMLQQGADPLTIQSMRMKQAEMQKALIGLSDARIAHQEKLNDEIYNGIESVRSANREALKNSPQQAAPAQTPSPLGPAVPGTGGMPAGMLPNMPQAQDIGEAPGTPKSLGQLEPGTAPTATEMALQAAANAPKPITQEGQLAYHKVLLRLAGMGVPVSQFPASLTSEADLDQAEAGAGLHKQQLADAKELADTQSAAGKGAQGQAEAEAAMWKPAGEGTLVNFKTGQMIHGVAPPDEEAFRDFIAHGGSAANWPAWKAQQEAQSTLPSKVQEATSAEIAKQNALAPSLQQIVNTTRAGRQYINRDDIPQGSAGVTEQQALKAGIPVVSKDTASTLEDIDTAKANQDYMLNQIGAKLATDPTGRLFSAPGNTIEKLAQTDPKLAAVGTYRNAAIQSLRAVAGSKGLRINQYEVQLAIDNDIPKITDTLPVAQQKLQNLRAFLDNTEQAHLVRNRQQSTAPGNAAQQTTGHQIGDLIVQNGKTFKATQVDANGKVLAADPL